MKLKVQNREVSPLDFSKYVVCKVLEDVDKNYTEYLKVAYPESENFTESDIATLNNWKHKLIVKLNKYMNKEQFYA